MEDQDGVQSEPQSVLFQISGGAFNQTRETVEQSIWMHWLALPSVKRDGIRLEKQSVLRIAESQAQARHHLVVLFSANVKGEMRVVIESRSRQEWEPMTFDEQVSHTKIELVLNAASQAAVGLVQVLQAT